MKGSATMVSLRKLCACSLVGMAAFFFMYGVAEATLIFTDTISVTAGDPTQQGRLSRNGIPQDWSGGEAFPGVINPAIAYHYTTLDLDVAALEGTAYGAFLQISFDSLTANTFLSAYLDSYDPLNLATNWLGDAGTSGNFFGVDPLFFQVVVPNGHHLILVLNDTTSNGAGLNQSGNVLVEAFLNTNYSDVPEPRTLELLACGLVVLVAARRFGRGAAT